MPLDVFGARSAFPKTDRLQATLIIEKMVQPRKIVNGVNLFSRGKLAIGLLQLFIFYLVLLSFRFSTVDELSV